MAQLENDIGQAIERVRRVKHLCLGMLEFGRAENWWHISQSYILHFSFLTCNTIIECVR